MAKAFAAAGAQVYIGSRTKQTLEALADVGNVAVFAASDQARMMTAATLNVSGGSVID